MNEIEFRGGQVVDVSHPKRTVTVIVAPYETETEIHTPYKVFTEIVSRGAYAGVERRSNIRANRDHSWDKLAGRIVASYPDRDEGLLADVKMFSNQWGTETLELCAEDGLSASAGFLLLRENGRHGPVKPDAEQWTDNGRTRRLNHLYLDHVAFVPDPAYETANVVDVRLHQHHEPTVPVAVLTPNLDHLELERWRAKLAAIDVRYGVQ